MKKIILNPQILSGKPIFEGTRISVELILELLGHGYSTDQILKEYPSLSGDDLCAAFQFTSQKLKEEQIYPIASL